MTADEILRLALTLGPAGRLWLVETLLRSLDPPSPDCDIIWAEEAERRLHAYREGRLEGIPMERIFEESR